MFNLLIPVLSSGGSSGFSFSNAEAETYVAAMSVEPDDDRKLLIDTYVGALKSAAIWTKLDILYLLAAHDSQAARINLKNPSVFTLADVSTGPSFVVDQGFTGNGSTTALNTQFTPSANGVNFVRDDCSIFFYVRVAGNTNRDVGGGNAPSTRVASNSAGVTTFRINDATDTAISNGGNTTGMFGVSRSGTTKGAFRNGASLGTATVASTGINAQSQYICAANNSTFSDKQISMAAWGSALTGLESSFYTATLSYLQGVGAA